MTINKEIRPTCPKCGVKNMEEGTAITSGALGKKGTKLLYCHTGCGHWMNK